jgi:MFS family permease
MSHKEAGPRGAFSLAHFRMLFLGTFGATTGFFMSTAVQGVVAFELMGTNSAVGSAVFGQGLGMFLLGPIAGAWADRLPKRRVVATGQLASAAVFAMLGLLYATERLDMSHLILGSFVIGAAFAFVGPARHALVADLVPIRLLGSAMALNNVANTISRVFGPSLAAIFLALDAAGAAFAYGAMTLLYSSSAVLLTLLPRSVVRSDVAETHVLHDLLEGIRYVWRHRRLRRRLGFFVSVLLIGFPHVTLVPGLLENELGRPAEDVTTLYTLSALGALAASITMTRYADSSKATRIYGAMAVGFGLSLVGLAFAPSFWMACGAMVLVGAASGGFHALNGAVVALQTERTYMGRVMSLSMLAFAGFGLTALPFGILADGLGERTVLLWMGIVVFTLSIWMTTLLLRERSDSPAG